MSWLTFTGELVGSAWGAYRTTSQRLAQQEINTKTDYCPDEVKTMLTHHLDDCNPASEHLTFWGRKKLEYHLGKNDYFNSLLTIDANTKSTKRAICITTLKVVAKCICSGYDEETLRAATYSYLALRYFN